MNQYNLIDTNFDDSFWNETEKNVRIIQPKFRWQQKKKYWFSIVTPDGNMFVPSNMDTDIQGHPDFAEKKIYAMDNILNLLFNYFIEEKTPEQKAIFMIFFGYISINEIVQYDEEIGNPVIFCNPFAIKQDMLNKLYSLGNLISSVDLDSVTEKQLILSLKVPFFKRKIISQLKKQNVDSIDSLLIKLQMDIDVFFMIINSKYKEFEKSLLNELEIDSFSTLMVNHSDLSKMIETKIGVSAEQIFEHLEYIDSIKNINKRLIE